MKIVGLITEYNPFHYGHLHHIQEARKITKADQIIVVMSGNHVQRGEVAIIDKWSRTRVALEHGVDLVIELPFVYAIQSADYFAQGAVDLLHKAGCTDIVFGSESGDIQSLYDIAYCIKENKPKYDQLIKAAMETGIRYAEACNQALSSLLNKSIVTPNDLLGLSYVKAVVDNNFPIQMHCIQRTNDFHSQEIQQISSASAIRNALKTNQDIEHTLPNSQLYKNELFYFEQYFPLLKYKLLTTSSNELKQLHLVEEGIENQLLKKIQDASNMEQFVTSLTSKRYTRGRIQRMIIHILMNNTSKEIELAKNVDYLRILGMNDNGKKYLNKIKKDCKYTLVSTFSSHKHPALEIEMKATKLMSCISSNPTSIIESEYKNIPIMITTQKDL
ncbi:nucleotidyltransferase [Tannockella kyphosi]|uniref:nucleotidyltransferase n=1 Tax=Tannockella kyphosi TaxID=2899121 RepID=UPI002012B09A|nr:nucleotidyltransferase [Tannockella kyphosi]